ncbi:hypothetical protein [Olivibacter sitiensis]|uniref:hypothetical protein n=1 Tax=Olivibacter sitiensis TaxID=376470 RepID=UPI0003FBFC91|nr:hypothetical protein [Olivibacter sitiensis]
MIKKMAKWFFFSNFFMGTIGLALSVETTIQLHLLIDHRWLYYLWLCPSIVLFYMLAYLPSCENPKYGNERSVWYYVNRRTVYLSFTLCLLLAIIGFTRLLAYGVSWPFLLTLSLTAIMSILYYDHLPMLSRYNLRKPGWTKCLTIGIVWANTVTLLPLFLAHAYSTVDIGLITWCYVKNFMFFTITAILFDVKDYEEDFNQNLKTLVVRIGYRNLLGKVIIPLVLLGIFSLIAFSYYMNYRWTSILMNLIPYVALLYTACGLYRSRSIFYYLILIDGLLLLKAICGIIAASQ